MSEISDPATTCGKTWRKFNELIEHEFRRLHHTDSYNSPAAKQPEDSDFQTALPGPADEPWVVFTRHDHFGIALSGGGIRSATFNLGLLQGLDRNRVLDHVDYLSTVSGGGYIGGFWTAWLHHRWEWLVNSAASEKALPQNTVNHYVKRRELDIIFPRQEAAHMTMAQNGAPNSHPSQDPESCQVNKGEQGTPMPENRERQEFRHLREFSRFLMPRVGFTQAETWNGIITIVSGIIPSLIGATALVITGLYLWLALNFFLLWQQPIWMALVFAVATGFWQAWAEWSLIRHKKAGDDEGKGRTILLIAATAVLCGLSWWAWRTFCLRETVDVQFGRWLTFWRNQLPTSNQPYSFRGLLFGPVVSWSAAAVVMALVRLATSRVVSKTIVKSPVAVIDRCAYRCLAPAVLWAGIAGIWEISRWLYGRGIGMAGPAGGTTVFAGLFIWLRTWLFAPQKESRGTRWFERLAATLKPIIPQLLAAACVVSFCIAVTLLVESEQGLRWPYARWFVGLSIGFLLLLLVCFNPAIVGMHDFYRARIARCFLGAASRRPVVQNRATFEQTSDDLKLCDAPGDDECPEGKNPGKNDNRTRYQGRPIHLICCAANNLAGDTLASLYRGCRSAVLSPHGISLGEYTAPLDSLRLSSALTASAAALNSQMGRVSMRLGPAVAIIMSALNLRLGLWVKHPLNPALRSPILPGRFFFFEMFGYTKSDEQLLEPRKRTDATDVNELAHLQARLATSRYVHLSDGAHFENLGLYELVRRHCRYIIISDCSADPQIGFDDLANALRCVREDFGVEIELDVAPLRPEASNVSAQHAVMGTIHYDGLAGCDKGTLLYFKPTLTGDEPPDVLQYHTRNPAFPHESTGDQFYDEAQWESYRRLGEHAANVVLRFLESEAPHQSNPVERLFLEASQRWHPAPARQEESFIELTQRCAALEAEVRDRAPLQLRLEFFPEVAAAGFGPTAGPDAADELQVVYFVMLAAQVMEDAWLSAQLDIYWSHPLNRGWIAYFERWASTPSFRRWWPVVRSLYSPGFADFVKERFNLRLHDYEARPEPEGVGAKLVLSPRTIEPGTPMAGLAWEQWLTRYGEPNREGSLIRTYDLTLDDTNGGAQAIQVGFLLYRHVSPVAVQWLTPYLFVPKSLIGAGILARFIDAVLARFKAERIAQITVVLEETPRVADAKARHGFRPDPAHRNERVETINFYKSRGFVYCAPGEDGQIRMLRRDFNPSAPGRQAELARDLSKK